MVKTLKVLFIGDIVARPGRRAIQSILPKLKSEKKIDLVIANVENLSGGRGITRETIYEMCGAGIDVFTSGNHIFFGEEYAELLNDTSLQIIRPLNYLGDVPGRGKTELEINSQKVLVLNLEGMSGFDTPVENPFISIQRALANVDKETIILLDFHADITSEKRAMGFYVDGKVSAYFGTHTHVPTADLQVLPKGTFYVSDVGMTGSLNSVLGVKKEIIIDRFFKPFPQRFEWQYEGEKVFNSVYLEIKNHQIKKYQRCDYIIP
jgi:hypothetical protein